MATYSEHSYFKCIESMQMIGLQDKTSTVKVAAKTKPERTTVGKSNDILWKIEAQSRLQSD